MKPVVPLLLILTTFISLSTYCQENPVVAETVSSSKKWSEWITSTTENDNFTIVDMWRFKGGPRKSVQETISIYISRKDPSIYTLTKEKCKSRSINKHKQVNVYFGAIKN